MPYSMPDVSRVAVTSDFNFPKWKYFGRGSGEDSKYYNYKGAGRKSGSWDKL